MTDYPTCTDCGRHASGWIDVKGSKWEPDLTEVRPDVWRCWQCREEPHPDMHVPSIKAKD